MFTNPMHSGLLRPVMALAIADFPNSSTSDFSMNCRKISSILLDLRARMSMLRAIVVAVAFVLSAYTAPAHAAAPVVWMEDGNVRIMQTDPPKPKNSVTLHAARGEFEPFQVVVRGPSGGLTNVNVRVSNLRSSSGAVIPQSALALYREHYVKVASVPVLGPEQPAIPGGMYPEWLIPFAHPITGADLSGASLDAAPFNVAAGTNQPVWVDVFVPRSAAPGQYTGTVTVASDQGSASTTVILNVWNFELPEELSLIGEGALWDKPSKEGIIELLKHNVAIRDLPDLAWQDELVKYGLRTTNAGFWTGIDLGRCKRGPITMKSPPSLSTIQSKRNQYRNEILVYGYFADEIGRCLKFTGFPDGVKKYAKALQDGGVTPLLTQVPQDAIWIPGPYIWPLPIHSFSGKHAREIDRALSDPQQQIWSYHNLYHDGVSPKMFFINSPPIHMRIQAGFMSQALRTTGLLFWRADNWRDKSTSWTTVKSYHGDGQIVAHGSVVGVPGVVAGVRLKRFRDGAEDYEYVALLKQAGEANYAMTKVRELATDNATWSKDMDQLLAVRQELGDKLHSLAFSIISHNVDKITDTSAQVKWELTEFGTGRLEYGKTPSCGTVREPTETSFDHATHRQTISGLAAATTYHYCITSENKRRQPARATGSFTTAAGS